MLTCIEIADFVLIDRTVINPGQGLLILTGETGAGKSILVDAIGALSGGKIDRDVIRHGQNRASVEAVFSNSSRYLPEELVERLGLFDDPSCADELILSREILLSGKSVCRINGRMVTLAALREISSFLIDIHGQHDQQSIFQTETHIQLLDRFGGEPISLALQEYQAIFHEYQVCLQQIAELGQDPAERARLLDMLAFQIKEIEAARIKPEEDEKLALRRKIVANAEKIRAALSEAYALLDGDSADTVLGNLGQIVNRVDLAVRHLPDLAESQSQIAEALFNLQNVAGDIRSALDSAETDPGELERIDERLDQLFRLKKKYGGSLVNIALFFKQARDKLDQLSDGEALYEKLQQKKLGLQQQLLFLGKKLTQCRVQAATSLEQKITGELGDLGMKGLRFSVNFTPVDVGTNQFSKAGLDRVEFLISPNPGEPLRPLAKIASGGEASRIMLAIKAILAQADQIPVLIFDEIDTGVSGRTAGKVAEKLHQLSGNRQVFCITHLAQIAAMADTHILIEKNATEGKTRTNLLELNKTDREAEIARLLSGGVGDSTAKQLAGQLLTAAEKLRQSAVPIGKS